MNRRHAFGRKQSLPFYTDDQGRVEEKQPICPRCALFDHCIDRRIYLRHYCSEFEQK